MKRWLIRLLGGTCPEMRKRPGSPPPPPLMRPMKRVWKWD